MATGLLLAKQTRLYHSTGLRNQILELPLAAGYIALGAVSSRAGADPFPLINSRPTPASEGRPRHPHHRKPQAAKVERRRPSCSVARL